MKRRKIVILSFVLVILLTGLLLHKHVNKLQTQISVLKAQNERYESRLGRYKVQYEIIYQGPSRYITNAKGTNEWTKVRENITKEEEHILVDRIEGAEHDSEFELDFVLSTSDYDLAVYWYYTSTDFDYQVAYVLEGRERKDIYLDLKQTGNLHASKESGRLLLQKIIILKIDNTRSDKKDIGFTHLASHF